MIVSIYLHRWIVDVLSTFGKLDDVVNKMLDEVDNGNIDLMDKPECGNREGCARYNVVVQNENYIDLVQAMGPKNKSISLRRFIYWFVENEIYNDLCWEPVNEFISNDVKKLNSQVDKVLSELFKLKNIMFKNKLDLVPIASIENYIKGIRK